MSGISGSDGTILVMDAAEGLLPDAGGAPSTFTVFEHDTTSGFSWSERDVTAVAAVNRALGCDVLLPVLKGRARELQAAQHVGVVRIAGRTIQILPKLYRPGNAPGEQRVREAIQGLLYLLDYGAGVRVREHGVLPLLTQGSDWFEILTRLFASHLMDEWQRGAARHYVSCDDDLPVVRGKWRLADQLRRPERRHRFEVTYDEFTADNPLNRAFRFVVERLWRLTRHAGNRRLLAMLREWMDEVSLLPQVTARDAAAHLAERPNQRYAPILNLARLFLDGDALQMLAGDLSSFALVFDMNVLFEKFVVEFIRRHRATILPPHLNTCELLAQSSGLPRYLARRDGHPAFHLQPDLVFRSGPSVPLILDTKYKLLDRRKRHLGIAESDFYQMYAYAEQYACPRILLLYPSGDGIEPPGSLQFVTERSARLVEAATLDLGLGLGTADARERVAEQLRVIIGGEA